jgi:hypothetical protein
MNIVNGSAGSSTNETIDNGITGAEVTKDSY